MWCMASCSPTPTSIPWWSRALSRKYARASLDRASTRCLATSFAVSATRPCGRMSASCRRSSSRTGRRSKGRAVYHSKRLALCHYWVAFAVFMVAVPLGFWQMLMRSPLPAPLDDSATYYASVTLHGTAMAYVVTTFFIMGFGYAVAATSLGRPIRGMAMAWIGFAICLLGTLMAVAAILSGQASVLYTCYPPLLASGWYYAGAFLLIGGSMIWVVLMVVNMAAWKRDNPGRPVPLAMFAISATAILWAWAASGVLLELVGILLPRALGWGDLVDAGLGRTLFSVTLHAIVYFWQYRRASARNRRWRAASPRTASARARRPQGHPNPRPAAARCRQAREGRPTPPTPTERPSR